MDDNQPTKTKPTEQASQSSSNQAITPDILDPHQFDMSKLSKLDAAILAIKRMHPEMNTYEIGKHLKKHGVSKSRHSAYHRLRENEYLHMQFDELGKARQVQMLREDYPKARKVLRKAMNLKEKDIPWAVKLAAAKIVTDKSLPDKEDRAYEQPVTIQNIDKLQILVQGDIT